MSRKKWEREAEKESIECKRAYFWTRITLTTAMGVQESLNKES